MNKRTIKHVLAGGLLFFGLATGATPVHAQVDQEPANQTTAAQQVDLSQIQTPPKSQLEQTQQVDAASSSQHFSRIAGANRYDNSAKISQAAFPSGAETVFLANGYKPTDSLAGAPLAVLEDGPILLTKEGGLPQAVQGEIHRLGAKHAVILGGEQSVQIGVEDQLRTQGLSVSRLGGSNRYAQAAEVAQHIIRRSAQPPQEAFLVGGEAYPDALSISSIAADRQAPILLTQAERLNDQVRSLIPQISKWTVLGGTSSVNESVLDTMRQLGAQVQRIGGRDRYEVNRNILNEYGLPSDQLLVVSGQAYSDALPASVLASKQNSRILLVANRGRGLSDQADFIKGRGVRRLTFVGGPKTLSQQAAETFMEAVQQEAESYAGLSMGGPGHIPGSRVTDLKIAEGRSLAELAQTYSDEEAYARAKDPAYTNKYRYSLGQSRSDWTPIKASPEMAADFNSGRVFSQDKFNEEFLKLINAERAKHGLAALSQAPLLKAGTQVRLDELVQNAGIRFHGVPHSRSDGSYWTTAFQYIPRQLGSVQGENTASTPTGGNPYRLISEKYVAERLFDLWTASPSHYQNMMNPELSQHYVAVGLSSHNTEPNPRINETHDALIGVEVLAKLA